MKAQSRNSILLLASANLISAFGGGSVLGKATNLVSIGGNSIGSIFAFFAGTTLGLLLLEIIQKNFSVRAPKWISLYGSLSSLLLIGLYHSNKIDQDFFAVFFLFILVLRFCFWFLSRIYRSNVASSHPRLLPLFEGSYVAGSVLGILFFSFILKNISILDVLIIDFCTQCVSFVVDYRYLYQQKQEPSKAISNLKAYKKIWPYLGAFCLISIACQVSLFQTAKLVPSGVLLIAAFYVGMLIASIVSAKWDTSYSNRGSNSFLIFEGLRSISLKNIILLLSLNGLALYLAITKKESIWFLVFLAILFSVIYELFALGLARKISEESNKIGFPNSIAKTYAIMAFSAAISICIFIGFEAKVELIGLTALTCFTTSFLILKTQHMKN